MKKAISFITIAILGITSVTPGFAANKKNTATTTRAAALASYSNSSGKSAFENSKLSKLQPKVIANMRKIEKSTLASLSGSTQKEYKRMLDTLIQETSSVFSEAKNYHYYIDEEGTTARVVAKVAEFNALVSEISSLPKDATPFVVSAEEKTAVESSITVMQKDLLVPLIEKSLKNYKESDLKETGELHISTESDMGKFSLDLDRYTSILSIMGLSQEMDFAAKISYEMKVPTMGTFDKTTGKYTPGVSTTASGSVKADVNVKIIDSKLYLLIQNASIDIEENTALGITKSDIQKAQAMLTYIQGKTFVVDLPKEDGEMNSAKMLANITKTVDILSIDSLFTPKRKVGDSYALIANVTTLKKIAAVYSAQNPSDNEIAKLAKDLDLFYKKDGGIETLTAKIQEANAFGTAVLTKANNVYNFNVQLNGRAKVEGGTFTLSASKGKFALLVKNPKESSEVSVKWENDTLLATAFFDGKENFRASGALSEKKANLAFNVLGKPFATFVFDTVGTDEYTYSFNISSEASTEIPMAFKFKMSGKEKLESGKFPIVTPTDTTPIKELEKKANSIK